MGSSRLNSLIEQFQKKSVAVVGDIILDHYVYGIPRYNPEADSPCLTISPESDYRLGGAANAAHNLRSLEARVSLFGIVGTDPESEIIRRLCEESGIQFFALSEGTTLKKTRIIGARHNHPLIRLDYGEHGDNLKPLSEEKEMKLFEAIAQQSKDCQGILFPDYDKRIFRRALAPKLITMAHARGILSMADPKMKNAVDAERFFGVRVVKPNLQESRLLIGDINGELSYEQLIKCLCEKMKSSYAVITCGKEGAIAYDGSYHHVPTRAREVSDVSGAGDTAAAALMLSLLSGATIVEAMHIANYAAGIAVEKAGTVAVTQDELIARILQENS